MIDVNSPLAGDNIDRSNPSDSYTAPYLQRTFGVVEAFKNYQNTLLFFSGNEVINDVPTGGTVPPYIRVRNSRGVWSFTYIHRPLLVTSKTTSPSTQSELFLSATVLLMLETFS